MIETITQLVPGEEIEVRTTVKHDGGSIMWMAFFAFCKLDGIMKAEEYFKLHLISANDL